MPISFGEVAVLLTVAMLAASATWLVSGRIQAAHLRAEDAERKAGDAAHHDHNGLYMRKTECKLQHDRINDKLDVLKDGQDEFRKDIKEIVRYLREGRGIDDPHR